MLTDNQLRAIRKNLTRVESQLGADIKSKLEQIMKTDMHYVDANYLTGLIMDLSKPLSFQARVDLCKDIEKEINSYKYTCCVCKLPIKTTGSYCNACSPNKQLSYRSYETLKEGYQE